MAQAPRRPELRSGRAAADIKSGAEHRFIRVSPPKSQYPTDLVDLRFQRSVARLYRLGPRVIAEMLAELGRQRLISTEIEVLVARYTTRLNPEMLLVTGGDQFAPVPIHAARPRP